MHTVLTIKVPRLISSRPPRPKTSGKINKKNSSSMTALDSVDSPTHFRPIGKLLHMNPDGSRVLELNKPPHGPFGFYIARGNAKYNHGEYSGFIDNFLSDQGSHSAWKTSKNHSIL